MQTVDEWRTVLFEIDSCRTAGGQWNSGASNVSTNEASTSAMRMPVTARACEASRRADTPWIRPRGPLGPC